MTKDFKKQKTSDNTFGQYGLGWMLGGIAIGLLIGVGMYALANRGAPPAVAATPQQGGDTAIVASNNASDGLLNTATDSPENMIPAQETLPEETLQDEPPGFSYHAVLPQLEIEIPESVRAAQEAARQKAEQQAEPKRIPTGFNGLQVGSYKTHNQAISVQERLEKKGLSSLVEQATVKGATWYRVRVGPAESRETLQQWQQTLSGMGISPMPVRM